MIPYLTWKKLLKQQLEIQVPLLKNQNQVCQKKIYGTGSKFCGFANQVGLFIRMQPHRFFTQIYKVELVDILLSSSAFSWFEPLNEQNSSMLEDFGTFMEEF